MSIDYDKVEAQHDALAKRGFKVGDVLECEGGRVKEHPTSGKPILKVQLWSVIDGTGPRWFVREYGAYRGITAFVPDLEVGSYAKEGTHFEIVKVSRMSVKLQKTKKPLFPYAGKM